MNTRLTDESIDQWLDRVVAQRQEEESIKCPYCGFYIYNADGSTDCEALYDHVTYWGSEDGPEEMECDNCEKTFLVEECVRRTFEVTRIGDDNG